jgi:hypothetical protein
MDGLQRAGNRALRYTEVEEEDALSSIVAGGGGGWLLESGRNTHRRQGDTFT